MVVDSKLDVSRKFTFLFQFIMNGSLKRKKRVQPSMPSKRSKLHTSPESERDRDLMFEAEYGDHHTF